jgi:hypothetical protein
LYAKNKDIAARITSVDKPPRVTTLLKTLSENLGSVVITLAGGWALTDGTVELMAQ